MKQLPKLMNGKFTASVAVSLLILPTLLAQDAKLVADNLKYSREFYAKVHFVAMADLSLGVEGKIQFKYDRYPPRGPERILSDDREYARKNGKKWLESHDWGETGKPADAATARRLNGWVSLIDARLNGVPSSNDPSQGATVIKFLDKRNEDNRERLIFEETREKPSSVLYPRFIFDKSKDVKADQALLSEFSGAPELRDPFPTQLE